MGRAEAPRAPLTAVSCTFRASERVLPSARSWTATRACASASSPTTSSASSTAPPTAASRPAAAKGGTCRSLEAMACGLPSIATDWGAHSEFVHDEISHSFRVKGTVKAVAKRPEYAGFSWADLDHLAQFLRHAYEHRDEATEKGRVAAVKIQKNVDLSSRGAEDRGESGGGRHREDLRGPPHGHGVGLSPGRRCSGLRSDATSARASGDPSGASAFHERLEELRTG